MCGFIQTEESGYIIEELPRSLVAPIPRGWRINSSWLMLQGSLLMFNGCRPGPGLEGVRCMQFNDIRMVQ